MSYSANDTEVKDLKSQSQFFFLYSIQNILYLPKILQNNPPNIKDGENA